MSRTIDTSNIEVSLERALRQSLSYESLDSSSSSSSSSSCCGPLAAAYRLPNIHLLPRAVAAQVRSSHADFLQAQSDWLHSHLVSHEIQAALNQLEEQQAEEPPAQQLQHQQQRNKANTNSANSNAAALLADASLTWQLAHARQYLALDSAEEGLDGSDAQQLQQKDQQKEASLLGLTWQTLSGAYKPQSSGIPFGSAIHTSHPSLKSSSSHSFTDPSSSTLQKSYHTLLLPTIESSLEERVDQLWNIYDPTGEERSRAEEDASNNNRDDETKPQTFTGGSTLPPLQSSDLPSLLTHRLNRLHEDRQRLLTIQRELSLLSSSIQQAQFESLHNSALILAQHQLQHSAEENRVDATWLQHKMHVISSKLAKMEKELQADTYLGVQVAPTTGYPAPAAPQNILPSLQVIHSALSALKQAKEEELFTKQNQIERYQSMGSAFDQLSLEYRALQKQIQNKQWSIQELQVHESNAAATAPSSQHMRINRKSFGR